METSECCDENALATEDIMGSNDEEPTTDTRPSSCSDPHAVRTAAAASKPQVKVDLRRRRRRNIAA
jgi:hypothetical protein